MQPIFDIEGPLLQQGHCGCLSQGRILYLPFSFNRCIGDTHPVRKTLSYLPCAAATASLLELGRVRYSRTLTSGRRTAHAPVRISTRGRSQCFRKGLFWDPRGILGGSLLLSFPISTQCSYGTTAHSVWSRIWKEMEGGDWTARGHFSSLLSRMHSPADFLGLCCAPLIPWKGLSTQLPISWMGLNYSDSHTRP